MSQPPPYSSNGPPINPDRRPLPPGWIEQWDARYVCCSCDCGQAANGMHQSPQLQDLVRGSSVLSASASHLIATDGQVLREHRGEPAALVVGPPTGTCASHAAALSVRSPARSSTPREPRIQPVPSAGRLQPRLRPAPSPAMGPISSPARQLLRQPSAAGWLPALRRCAPTGE